MNKNYMIETDNTENIRQYINLYGSSFEWKDVPWNKIERNIFIYRLYEFLRFFLV